MSRFPQFTETTDAETREKYAAEYRTWIGIRQRCHAPKKERDRKNYQARGIVVCARWHESFANFLADMGPRPVGEKKYSIDRIDNDGPYSPENCRWATSTQQTANASYNRYIIFGGIKRTVRDWARSMNVNYYTLWSRLRCLPLDVAMTAGPNDRFGRWNGGTSIAAQSHYL